MPPIETGDESVSRRSASLRWIGRATRGRVFPPARVDDRTSDTPVATFARYRCAPFSRWRVLVHRFCESSQDRFHLTVVTRCGFSRSEAPSVDMGRALLLLRPLGRRLRTLRPQVSPKDRSLRFSWGQPARWLQPTCVRVLGSSSLAAPPGTPGRRIREASYVTARHWLTRPRARLYIRGPSPRSPRPPTTLSGVCVQGKGFCGSEPPIDFCKRDLQRTGTSTRVASAPASCSRAPCEVV